VYRTLGYGFLEHVYSLALERELRERGHAVSREFGVVILYKGVELTAQRLDMVIDGRVVVEIKAGHELPRVASRQLFNYLRATRLEVGLLLHFGPRPSFHRIVSLNERETRSVQPSVPQCHRCLVERHPGSSMRPDAGRDSLALHG
jgi:GxxExxY protein